MSECVVPHGPAGPGRECGSVPRSRAPLPTQAWKEARGVWSPSPQAPRLAQPCRGRCLRVFFLGGESRACWGGRPSGPGGRAHGLGRRGVAVVPGLAPHAYTSVTGNSVDRCCESRPTVERSLRCGERGVWRSAAVKTRNHHFCGPHLELPALRLDAILQVSPVSAPTPQPWPQRLTLGSAGAGKPPLIIQIWWVQELQRGGRLPLGPAFPL